MNEPVLEQRCPKCRLSLPATSEHFHHSKGVLRAICIACERLSEHERKRWKKRMAS